MRVWRSEYRPAHSLTREVSAYSSSGNTDLVGTLRLRRLPAVVPASSLEGRNAVCKRLQLHFSPSCAGYGGLELPTAPTRIRRLEPASSQKGNFGEAYFHFCNASFHVL